MCTYNKLPQSTENLNAVIFTCVYESVCESFWEEIPIRSKTVCHAGFNCFSSGIIVHRMRQLHLKFLKLFLEKKRRDKRVICSLLLTIQLRHKSVSQG